MIETCCALQYTLKEQYAQDRVIVLHVTSKSQGKSWVKSRIENDESQVTSPVLNFKSESWTSHNVLCQMSLLFQQQSNYVLNLQKVWIIYSVSLFVETHVLKVFVFTHTFCILQFISLLATTYFVYANKIQLGFSNINSSWFSPATWLVAVGLVQTKSIIRGVMCQVAGNE